MLGWVGEQLVELRVGQHIVGTLLPAFSPPPPPPKKQIPFELREYYPSA